MANTTVLNVKGLEWVILVPKGRGSREIRKKLTLVWGSPHRRRENAR
jgi:hypothetical protein